MTTQAIPSGTLNHWDKSFQIREQHSIIRDLLTTPVSFMRLAISLILAAFSCGAVAYGSNVQSPETPVVAYSSESDRALEAAIEAFSSTTKPKGLAGSNLTGEQKKPEVLRYRTHHRHWHCTEDSVLIMGGAEAFAM